MPYRAYAINTPKLNKLVKFLKMGMSRNKACYLSKVNEKTFYNYINRGEKLEGEIHKLESQYDVLVEKKAKDRDIYKIRNEIEELLKDNYILFLQKIRIAETEDDLIMLGQINKSIKSGDVKTATWKIERKDPKRWGRKLVELTGRDGGPVETKVIIEVEDVEDE